jgi:hypothetical protein
MLNVAQFFTHDRTRNAWRFAVLLAVVYVLTPTLYAQGDPLSLLSDRASRIAEYVCYGIAIVLLIVAAIQAMAGERNGMMAIGGAIVFAVIGLNARDIASMLRF